MADISKIKLPGDATVYNLKDAEARTSIANLQSSVTGAMHYIGTSSTAITDGGSELPTINGTAMVASDLHSGDVVVYGTTGEGTAAAPKEYIWNGTKWEEFGSTGSLKALAFKDTATAAAQAITIKTDVALNTTTKYTASSATGGGSVTAGSAAECTFPQLTATVTTATELLELGWTNGSFTANTPTAVTLPSFTSTTIATGVKTQPAFQAAASTVT